MPRHRSPSNRTVEDRWYPFGSVSDWPASQWAGLARIWRGLARSGLLLFFSCINFCYCYFLLHSKLFRKSSGCQKFVFQISLWSLLYYLSSGTACKYFWTLDNIWELKCVDLVVFTHKSKSGVWYYEIEWFQFSVMLCCIVRLEKLFFYFRTIIFPAVIILVILKISNVWFIVPIRKNILEWFKLLCVMYYCSFPTWPLVEF
jgi:hypothetical protein